MGGELIAILIFLGLVFLFVLAKTAQSLIHISGPNEVLVFSGLKHRLGNRTVGYKLVKGGKGLRIPLLETVDRIDLTNMIIDVTVGGAYSKGGIPLNVQAVANVKVAGDDPLIHNALERLLGKPRNEIMKIARETLEGNLRGVLATLTPEQVNEDKQAFAQSLLSEAEHDLSALGLSLDTLKIQSVTDDQGYLAAIGRRQSAELLRRARIAEANAKAEAAVTEARNHEETVLAQIQARTEIARAEAERRITDAQTMRPAKIAEEQAEVTAQVARAEADVPVQEARIEQVKRLLQAEVIEPALAHRDARIFEAEGEAAQIIEDGRARAEALQEITDVWLNYGESAKRALLMQKLEPVVELLTSTIDHIEVERLTILGGNPGQNGEDNDESWSLKAIRTMEELKGATGIDVEDIAKKFLGAAPATGDAPAGSDAATRDDERSRQRDERRAQRRQERDERRASEEGARSARSRSSRPPARNARRRENESVEPRRPSTNPLAAVGAQEASEPTILSASETRQALLRQIRQQTADAEALVRSDAADAARQRATDAAARSFNLSERSDRASQIRAHATARSAIQQVASAGAQQASSQPTAAQRAAARQRLQAATGGQWYAATRDKRIGPLDFPALMRHVESGDVPRAAFIWRTGMGEWERISDSEAWQSAEQAWRENA